MTRTLIVESPAAAEISNSVDWYERRNPPACAKFVDSLAMAFRSIAENPDQHQIVYRTVRRALLAGFPYALFYVVKDERIHVISFHTSRDPAVWRERLR